MMTPAALSWIFSAASSRLIAMTLPVRGRLIYPEWELQPINSYAWRAAPRSSSAPASLGHARAVILWGGFSVEVDGGSNRGAYQAAWANLRARSQSRAGAFGFLN